MKRILLVICLFTASGCKEKDTFLCSGEWILANQMTFAPLAKTDYYNEGDRNTVFEFKQDGTFFYEEKKIPKGDSNTWKVDHETIILHWKGMYIDKPGKLDILKLDNNILMVSNEQGEDGKQHIFTFLKENSPYWKNNAPGTNIYTGEKP